MVPLYTPLAFGGCMSLVLCLWLLLYNVPLLFAPDAET